MLNIKINKYLYAFIFFVVPVLAQDPTEQEEREKMIKEYQAISERLMDLQKQALSDIGIAKQAEDFSQKLEKAIIKGDSSLLNKINRREEIIEQFEAADKNDNSTEIIILQQEYQEITQDLMVHQQKALESNIDLKEEGEQLEGALFEKMKELDPEVPQLISRLESLGNQIQGLDGERKL